MRLLLTQRRNLKRKFLDIENTIRHSLKAFGIRLKGTGRGGFERAVRDAVAGDALTSELMDAMLNARAALWKQYGRLHDLVVKFVARDELCRRFMQIPGVGPVTALSFMTSIDDPSRFRRSRDVAAYFGLTSRRWQSGTSIDVQGRISKAGDPDVRRALYEAASALLTRFKGKDKYLMYSAQATIYLTRVRDRLWSFPPSRWVAAATIGNVIGPSVLAYWGILMAPVAAPLLLATLTAIVAAAVLLDQVKIWIFQSTGILGRPIE